MSVDGDAGGIPIPSGTVTFLFSDIEGSTQRWDRDRTAMQEAVRLHDRLLRAAIAAHRGYVFKTVGDAFCAAFATPKSAAGAALDAERALEAADFLAVGGLRVRMAINTGTAEERDGDYFGTALNRVARLLSLGHGGQILLSGIAADLVREDPPPEATLVDLGARPLKDLERHEGVYQLVAPGVQRDFAELRARVEPPWLVPDIRTRYFTGREELLALLRAQLVERHRAALCGLGGVGKTQAALEYAARHRAEYPHGIFWVNAETPGSLSSGFAAIATALRLAVAEAGDRERIVDATIEWLKQADRWLLILDNVDDRRAIARFVPQNLKGDVLITSREITFSEFGVARGLEVLDLDGEEAVRFLFRRTGREGDEPGEGAAATELAAELGNLPLALEQAAAYVIETGARFADYLSAFRKRRVALLERAGGLIPHDSVAVTWAANFEAAQRVLPAAAEVLRLSAFLAPDGIPFELFGKGGHALGATIAEAVADYDELSLPELLRPLARYSLIRLDARSETYSIHRLVQEVVRSSLGETERKTYVELGVAGLFAAFPRVEYGTWPECERLLPHARAALDALPKDTELLPAAELARQCASYLFARGEYGASEQLCTLALAVRERAQGSDHPDVSSALNNLAVLYMELGRYAEAEPLYPRAIAIREKALGPDHPKVATNLSNLAIVYIEQGRYAEAEPLLRRALEIREKALAPDHPHVVMSQNNLGVLYRRQGRYAEAESLLARVLAIREQGLEPGHPDVALTLMYLADVYRDWGRGTEAEPLYLRALAIWEEALEAFGLDHPDVAEALNGLAAVYREQGRHAEAKALLTRALAIHERAHGSDHPFTIASRDALDAMLPTNQARR